MSREDCKSDLELALEKIGFRKYEFGESTDRTEELIHYWYRENGEWKFDSYIKKKTEK